MRKTSNANETFNKTLNFSVRAERMRKDKGYFISLSIQYTTDGYSCALLVGIFRNLMSPYRVTLLKNKSIESLK